MSKESQHYSNLGASSSKSGVHEAVGYKIGREFFSEVIPDIAGDPAYYSLLHADGAGTKSVIAYIAYRESSDPSWFSGLALDSLAMNLDDVACVGAFENLTLSNTIGRNRLLVPDSAIKAIVSAYRTNCENLRRCGIEITLSGGETADVGDVVRTLIVDSTLLARVKREKAVSFARAQAGDIIIGLSSSGRAAYESEENSGIGSNGLTLARHALIKRAYAQKYPEILDPNLDPQKTYCGTLDLFDTAPGLKTSLVKALLSPTRSYAPILKAILNELPGQIHGLVHCTGGGQTKIVNFGQGKRYIKNNLFKTPPIYELIQKSMNIPWREMYSVFNMGHRMEIICPQACWDTANEISANFGVEAKIIGSVEAAPGNKNELLIDSSYGKFEY